MIESNIKKLSRVELFYICIADMVKYLDSSNNKNLIDEFLEHYLDSDDQNSFVYHSEDTYDKKMSSLIKDLNLLNNICSKNDFSNVKQFKILDRLIREQTVSENNSLRLKTKEDKEMDSKIIQSPYDPEAIYRKKSNKEHSGYVANIIESGNKGNTIIEDYAMENNTYSDVKFMDDYIEGCRIKETTEDVITTAHITIVN